MTALHLKITPQGNTVFDFGSNSSTKDPCGIVDSCTTFNGPGVSGWHREILLEDFRIGYADLKFTGKPVINFTYTGKAIEMLFILKGHFSTHFSSHKVHHRFHKHAHNLFYCDSTHGTFEPEDEEAHFVSICLNPAFFEKFLPATDAFHTFRLMISNRQTGYLNTINYPISPEMYFIVQDIMRPEGEGHCRKVFLHAKVLELLFLQMEQYSKTPVHTIANLSRSDRDKIYRAKAYLTKNYGQKITLPGLAQKIGTNEFLLKNGFKTVFGTTVFGCIHHLRMTKARQLLLEQQLTVSQVSDISGYKNPQHFSTAFKKKFGVVPSKLKNRQP